MKINADRYTSAMYIQRVRGNNNKMKNTIKTIQTKVNLLSEIEEALKAIYGKNFKKEFHNLIVDGFTLEEINTMVNIKEIKKQVEALREVLDQYNSQMQLHQEALGPHFNQDIFDRWFTQQINKEEK